MEMATGRGRIHQINSSHGGVPKLLVEEAMVGPLGIAGDYQRDTRHHGGPDRALCLYALEQIQRLQGEGHPIFPGSVGENITLEGIDNASLTPGTRLRLGDVVEIELTSYTAPCENVAESFADGDFTRISEKLHPGESRIYARVLSGGVIRMGDPVLVYAQDASALH
jgi:MOSC domain-containing protein YiiM